MRSSFPIKNEKRLIELQTLIIKETKTIRFVNNPSSDNLYVVLSGDVYEMNNVVDQLLNKWYDIDHPPPPKKESFLKRIFKRYLYL